MINYFFIYICKIIFFLLCISGTNIYVSKFSVSWEDPNNWSLGRTPIFSDDVIISQGSEIILFNPYNNTIINNINIENGCVFYSFSVLEISNSMVNKGKFITSFKLISKELILSNGILWIIDGYINVERQINIGSNDSIIMGPCNYNICGIYIYSNVVNNGKISIFPDVIGITFNYTQTETGALYLQYYKTSNSVGSLFGENMDISGKIFVTTDKCEKTSEYSCNIILLSFINDLIVKNKPQNDCVKINKYIMTDNSNMTICF